MTLYKIYKLRVTRYTILTPKRDYTNIFLKNYFARVK